MSKNVIQMNLGQSDIVKDDGLLGALREFMDRDFADPGDVAPLSGAVVRARYVLNDSGGTLAKGSGVVYKSGYTLKRIGGNHSANGVCDGIVDPYLPAAVADGAYFWIIEQGPVLALAGSGGLAANNLLQTAASGTFVAGTLGTNSVGHCGRAQAAITATELGRVVFKAPFSCGI